MNPTTSDPQSIRETVSENYAGIARKKSSCCGSTSCCGGDDGAVAHGRALGYDDAQLGAVPQDANLGLGCGNPTAIDTLKPGETVLDLGSGAGMDVFVAARQVGPQGHVIGVDMTDEMLSLARRNAAAGGYTNVEFRKGIIEALPVEDGTVDAILSNCVINLSPEKDRVFAEAFRVLRPGGRLMVSDILVERPLPQAVLDNVAAYVGCVSGAVLPAEYRRMMEAAGFVDVRLTRKAGFGSLIVPDDARVQEAMAEWGMSIQQLRDLADAVVAYDVYGVRPPATA